MKHKPKSKKKEKITKNDNVHMTRLPADEMKRIKILSKDTGLTVSAILRAATKRGLNSIFKDLDKNGNREAVLIEIISLNP